VRDAQAAFGEEGSFEYDVPPNAPIRVMATLVSVVPVDDLSADADRKALRTIVSPGTGLFSPKQRYDCTVDYSAVLIPPPPASLPAGAEAVAATYATLPLALERTAAVVTLGTPSPDAAVQREACGGADIELALQLLLPRMLVHETSELICMPGLGATNAVDVSDCEGGVDGGGGGCALKLTVTMHSWVCVDEVDGTGSHADIVTKRVLHAPIYVAGGPALDIPKPEATCRVRYVACVARGGRAAIERGAADLGEQIEEKGVILDGSGPVASEGEVLEFKQGERIVLPCIDAAVLAMKCGERALLTSPAVCAFGAPNFPPALVVEPRFRSCQVEVLIELVGFDPPPETNGVHVHKIMPLHAERKEAGTRLFGIGALREAAAKWELAEKTLPHGNSLKYDLERGGRAADEVAAMRTQVEKVQLSCQLNLATVYLKLGEPAQALENAEKALKAAPGSLKGLLRRAQARLRIPPVNVEVVRADLMAAAKIDPKNLDVREELEKLRQVNAAQKREEKSMYGGMFARAAAAAPALPAKPAPPKLPGSMFGDVKLASTAFGRRDG
jgi:hypothetical protein